MKRFRFPLQAVLTVRQRHEQEALESYARALLERQRILESLEALQRELSSAWNQLRHQMAGGCSAADLNRLQTYNRSLETLRDEYTLALGNAERRVQATLHNVLRARRERELVEHYRDKQKARHARQQDHLERRGLDEFATRRSGAAAGWRGFVESPL